MAISTLSTELKFLDNLFEVIDNNRNNTFISKQLFTDTFFDNVNYVKYTTLKYLMELDKKEKDLKIVDIFYNAYQLGKIDESLKKIIYISYYIKYGLDAYFYCQNSYEIIQINLFLLESFKKIDIKSLANVKIHNDQDPETSNMNSITNLNSNTSILAFSLSYTYENKYIKFSRDLMKSDNFNLKFIAFAYKICFFIEKDAKYFVIYSLLRYIDKNVEKSDFLLKKRSLSNANISYFDFLKSFLRQDLEEECLENFFEQCFRLNDSSDLFQFVINEIMFVLAEIMFFRLPKTQHLHIFLNIINFVGFLFNFSKCTDLFVIETLKLCDIMIIRNFSDEIIKSKSLELVKIFQNFEVSLQSIQLNDSLETKYIKTCEFTNESSNFAKLIVSFDCFLYIIKEFLSSSNNFYKEMMNEFGIFNKYEQQNFTDHHNICLFELVENLKKMGFK